MRLPVLLLANAATVENGLLNVAGGGWENYTCPSFPWGIAGALCGIAEVAEDERAAALPFYFRVRDHSGQDLGVNGSMVMHAAPGDGTARAPFVWNFSLAVAEPQLAIFSVAVEPDGPSLAELALPIRAVPSNIE